MNQCGSGLLIVLVAILVLLIAGALFFVKPAAAPGTPGAAARGAHLALSVSCARTATGLTATVTATNDGAEHLRNVRIPRVSIQGLAGGPAAPIVLGRLDRGATATFTVPFSGAAPAPKSPVTLEIDHQIQFGWGGSGGGSSSVTSFVP